MFQVGVTGVNKLFLSMLPLCHSNSLAGLTDMLQEAIPIRSSFLNLVFAHILAYKTLCSWKMMELTNQTLLAEFPVVI